MSKKAFLEGRSPSRTRALVLAAIAAGMDPEVVELAPATNRRARGYLVPEALVEALKSPGPSEPHVEGDN